jgi:hypothetical protein
MILFAEKLIVEKWRESLPSRECGGRGKWLIEWFRVGSDF